MTGDRTYKPRGRWRTFRLTSHRLGIILIVLSLVWGMYLIQLQLNDRRSQSEYLKQKIIALSKEYIDAIAKEKGLYTTELGDSDNGKKLIWHAWLPVICWFVSARGICKFLKISSYFDLYNVLVLQFCSMFVICIDFRSLKFVLLYMQMKTTRSERWVPAVKLISCWVFYSLAPVRCLTVISRDIFMWNLFSSQLFVIYFRCMTLLCIQRIRFINFN